MSTHAMVYIKLKDEDKNKEIETKFGKLGIPDADAIGIYCHHDGYEDGVGEELKCNFSTYEEALELIKNGHTSYIEGNDIGYYSESEGFGSNKPVEMDIASFKDYTYQYLFEGGEWKLWNSKTKTFENY